MSISISNIAWNPDEDDAVGRLLADLGVRHIDVAPSKYFPVFAEASDAAVAKVRRFWEALGIDIIGMQSLLFGTEGLNVFASVDVQLRLLEHLRHVFRIGSSLGATRAVFGSPRNRDRGSLPLQRANEAGAAFFHRVGEAARLEGITLCLEPNPECYGANFMTHTEATAEVVRLTGHSHVRMQFDTGSIFINGEEPAQLLQRHADIIGHVHLSEPGLAPLGTRDTNHAEMAILLRRHMGDIPLTIEMLRPAEGEHAIRASLQFVLDHYRPQSIGASP
ncbi:TIM barrel protein [Stenotrophomonas sp. PS02299]|uniref:sugar phosphate isomerase/epimerase family protein n=1 Tax=Stenotrophomonas TaxID=40323 RepID=UPI002499BC1B|nr:TIM barrel protein [Stenotrophomonas sp. PS02299]